MFIGLNIIRNQFIVRVSLLPCLTQSRVAGYDLTIWPSMSFRSPYIFQYQLCGLWLCGPNQLHNFVYQRLFLLVKKMPLTQYLKHIMVILRFWQSAGVFIVVTMTIITNTFFSTILIFLYQVKSGFQVWFNASNCEIIFIPHPVIVF